MITRCNFCGDLFVKKYKNSNIFAQLVCPKCSKEIFKRKLTLGVGILHYSEKDDVLLQSLLSIDNQIKFNFDCLEVVIVTDGGGVKINEKYILSQLKNIKPKFVYRKINGKCGGTRNTIINKLKTDYIMFLDADDELASSKVLSHIYKKINKFKPEIYCSAVLEEQYDGRWQKYTNLMCLNMCHGKAFKRDALIYNNIWFDPTIQVGEDLVWLTSLYNVCDSIYYDSNFSSYRWKFNRESITRNTGVDVKLDSYYRCFDSVMLELNDWYSDIKNNNFVNENFITMMYNIFYYRIMLSSNGEQREKYLKQFFEYVIHPVNFELSDNLDKNLNKHLLKKIKYFSKAFAEYKEV